MANQASAECAGCRRAAFVLIHRPGLRRHASKREASRRRLGCSAVAVSTTRERAAGAWQIRDLPARASAYALDSGVVMARWQERADASAVEARLRQAIIA